MYRYQALLVYIMAEIHVHLIGDSNIDRHLPKLKSTEDKDPLIQSSTMVRATNMVQLKDAILSYTEQLPLVVLAGLTNPITSHMFDGLPGMRENCVRTFSQIRAWIQEGRTTNPGSLSKVVTLLIQIAFYVCSSLFAAGLYSTELG